MFMQNTEILLVFIVFFFFHSQTFNTDCLFNNMVHYLFIFLCFPALLTVLKAYLFIFIKLQPEKQQ